MVVRMTVYIITKIAILLPERGQKRIRHINL
jgi:hypothetical protein